MDAAIANPTDSPARRGQKLRLKLAVAVFAAWVASLAIMAVTSGRRPQARAPQAAATP